MAGLSQPELATRVGVKQQAISAMESDNPKNTRQGSKHVAALAAACDVSAMWLASGQGPIHNGSLTSVSENVQSGGQSEERMRTALTTLIEGLILAFDVNSIRAEIQRYEERAEAKSRPTQKARA